MAWFCGFLFGKFPTFQVSLYHRVVVQMATNVQWFFIRVSLISKQSPKDVLIASYRPPQRLFISLNVWWLADCRFVCLMFSPETLAFVWLCVPFAIPRRCDCTLYQCVCATVSSITAKWTYVNRTINRAFAPFALPRPKTNSASSHSRAEEGR